MPERMTTTIYLRRELGQGMSLKEYVAELKKELKEAQGG
jgi:hypothetical protein